MPPNDKDRLDVFLQDYLEEKESGITNRAIYRELMRSAEWQRGHDKEDAVRFEKLEGRLRNLEGDGTGGFRARTVSIADVEEQRKPNKWEDVAWSAIKGAILFLLAAGALEVIRNVK